MWLLFACEHCPEFILGKHCSVSPIAFKSATSPPGEPGGIGNNNSNYLPGLDFKFAP